MKKTCFITGGFSPIGKIISKALAENNYSLILQHVHDLNNENNLYIKYIEKNFQTEIFTVQGDFNALNELETIWTQVQKHSPHGIHILINNAGCFYKTPLLDIKESDWNEFLSINLIAPALLTVYFIKQECFSEENPGKIINIIDIYADKPMPSFIPYAVSKSGLASFTKQTAKAAGAKFRINGISPGIVNEGTSSSIIKKSVTGKRVTEQEIADTCLFLINSKSITGEIIHVDGGKNIY